MRSSFLPSVLLAALAVGGCYSPTLVSPGYYCHPDDSPACPDGQECINNRCQFASGPSAADLAGGLITKPVYNPPTQDPMLNDAAACPDTAIENNDDRSTANPFDAQPDMPQPQITNVAICPTGIKPITGAHDRDYVRVDTTTYGGNLTLMAEISYDVKYGDLDVGVMDDSGKLIAQDGTAVSNGCVAAAATNPGSYYVVVVGAQDKDVNRYSLRVRTFTKPQACGAPGTPDLATKG